MVKQQPRKDKRRTTSARAASRNGRPPALRELSATPVSCLRRASGGLTACGEQPVTAAQGFALLLSSQPVREQDQTAYG